MFLYPLSLCLIISHSSWVRLSSLVNSSICNCLSLNKNITNSFFIYIIQINEMILLFVLYQELSLKTPAICFFKLSNLSSFILDSLWCSSFSFLISTSCFEKKSYIKIKLNWKIRFKYFTLSFIFSISWLSRSTSAWCATLLWDNCLLRQSFSFRRLSVSFKASPSFWFVENSFK